MKKDVKVLILYAHYGEGHLQVSRALKTSFQNAGIRNVTVKDLFAEAHPLIDRVTRYIYKKSYTIGSGFYGWFYNVTKNMNHNTFLSRLFNSFGISKLRDIIRQEKPDLVINTFPMLAMPELCRIDEISIPVYTVVTDFTLHNRWIHPEITMHYVPTIDLKKTMMREGIDPKRIKVSGIPLREEFHSLAYMFNSFHLLDIYRLCPSKKTILIMADFHNRKTVKKICSDILSAGDYQILLVCGKNQRLKEEMGAFFDEQQLPIRVLGFVSDLHTLMGMASCIITKAGGVTLSEALALGVPPVIFSPVAGQEMENARYLVDKGAAIISYRTDDLVFQVNRLLRDEKRLFEINKAIQLLRKRNAAKNIIQDILTNIEWAAMNLDTASR
ncbi:MGDG synthase family glycosyltransferase [Aneurinibacillus terranovensis]|uniref:MGDG synthase family glycosyltransferase n=1 Tax=Aneurinibacillus terranovensis TaxID=278991 RepID=UPI0004002F70|nr:glycosyltransferase [Aneurinibacillus terranovensis]